MPSEAHNAYFNIKRKIISLTTEGLDDNISEYDYKIKQTFTYLYKSIINSLIKGDFLKFNDLDLREDKALLVLIEERKTLFFQESAEYDRSTPKSKLLTLIVDELKLLEGVIDTIKRFVYLNHDDFNKFQKIEDFTKFKIEKNDLCFELKDILGKIFLNFNLFYKIDYLTPTFYSSISYLINVTDSINYSDGYCKKIKEIILLQLKFLLYKFLRSANKQSISYINTLNKQGVYSIDNIVSEIKPYFKRQINQIEFVHFGGDCYNSFDIEKYELNLKESFRNDFEIQELIKFYKRYDRLDDLEKLFMHFKSYYQKDDDIISTINYIHIGNQLLSQLIRNYSSDNDSKKIEKIYKLIKKKTPLVQDKINNFYTDYQYSIFLYEQIKLLIKNKKYTKKIEKKSEQAFSLLNEISKDIRVSDITPYYFVRDELNKVTITNLNSNFASMFVPNLYFIPFDSEKIKSLTEDLKLEIRSIIEVHNIESIKDSLSKELNENKTKSIEVLSIFAGIVIFTSGSIQIFTQMKTLGDALLFTGMFGASLIFMVASVSISSGSHYYYGFWDRVSSSKSFKTIGLGILLLVATFLLYFKFDDVKIKAEKETVSKSELTKNKKISEEGN